MGLELSRSAGGFDHPPDRQAEALHEMGRQQAKANLINKVQTVLTAMQLEVLKAIHDQLEEVKRLNENDLAIQQELLNRDQLQQNLEEFIYQTEKLVEEFSSKSDISASTRYFTLQNVLVQIDEDSINTAIIRGRENKAAFEKVVANIRQLIAILLKDPEVQEAIERAEKEMAKRLAKQMKIENELGQLQAQRANIESKQQTITYTIAAHDLFNEIKPNIPPWSWFAMVPVVAFAVYMVVPLIIAGIVAIVTIYRARSELEKKTNGPVDYQLSVIDEKIHALESELNEL